MTAPLRPDAPPAAVTDACRLEALAAHDILDTPPEQGFENAVRLASRLCETPVALVSLVAARRQWFKARVGFPPRETDLDSSVCKFVLTEPDLLVIPDLTQDVRTQANPLVTGAPHIRFYAGAPLRTPEGDTLGSLCVIDTVPRPEGLTPDQSEDLRALARQVVDLLELRVGRARLTASEAHWRGLFTQMHEGFFTGAIIRDPEGRATDFRFLEINPSFERQMGLSSDAAGRTAREVVPSIRRALIDMSARVVASGEPATIEVDVPALGRVFEARARKESDERFAVLFLDITERRQADRRRAAMLELGDRLRDVSDAAAIGPLVGAILGRTLGLTHAGYGAVDHDQETIIVAPGWTAPEFASLAGVHRFRDYGSYIADLKRGATVLIPDVAADPRTAGEAGSLIAIGARAMANLPILERGRFVSMFLALRAEPHDWTQEEVGFLRNVADRARAAIARLEAEERQRVLNEEMSHRLKNTLAMVQSIATQTLRSVPDKDPVEAFEKRIHALASAHEVLLRKAWTSAELAAVADAVIGHVAPPGRIALSGPQVLLGPRATMSLSLVLHELATNAAKYGALSNEAGRVDVTWRLAGAEADEIVLDWRETGGPPVREPTRRGFGSRLIGLGLVGTGGVALRYIPAGFHAEMRAPLTQFQQS